MAFFPHNVFNNNHSNASFTPLFRLFDEIDTFSRQGNSNNNRCTPNVRRVPTPTWSPKFDIRETGESYELYGELPGVSKEEVSIEFSEPQTLVVRGKAERNYTVATPENEDATMSGAISQTEEPKSPRSHQATVEDDADAQGSDWENLSHKGDEKQDTPALTPPVEQAPKKQATDTAKYWLSERSFGDFARTFNFPSRVDQDNVSANFKDGVLSVVVPKAKKYEATRVSIN